jgi:hypothetical protein
MKKEYDIKDTVWIHMGERKLVKGRVVEIIDLEHLNEGHDPNNELYVIEVPTGIDNVYEVREFGTISPDPQGPIAAFRREGLAGANRFLKKVGMPIQGFDQWQESKTPQLIKQVTNVPTNNPEQAPSNKPKKKRYYRGKPAKKPA